MTPRQEMAQALRKLAQQLNALTPLLLKDPITSWSATPVTHAEIALSNAASQLEQSEKQQK